jgi:hypothetical protein
VKHPLEQLLDGCIAQLNTGVDLEVVLAAHPEVADELRPLLATAVTTQVVMPPPLRKAERKDAFLAQVAAHRRSVEAVDGYVVELKAGVPLADVLAEAPAALHPLLIAAWRMHSTPAPEANPERRAAGKAAVVALAARKQAERMAALSPSLRDRARIGVAALLPAHRRGRQVWNGALGTSMAVLVLFVGVAGLGSASASSLPGEAFYHVKRLGESAQLLFAFEPARRAELNLQFTERRLQEMRLLSEQDHEVPLAVVEDWLRAQSNAWADIQNLPVDQKDAFLKLLVGLAGTGEAMEGRLSSLVSDPTALSRLLAESERLMRSVRSANAPAVPVGSEADLIPTPFRAAPVPVSEQPEPQVQAPVIAPVAPPAAVVLPPVNEQPAALAPVDPPIQAPPAEEPEDNDDKPAAGVPGASQPVTTPTVTAEPPPIVVPPLEDPNGAPSDPGGQPPTP